MRQRLSCVFLCLVLLLGCGCTKTVDQPEQNTRTEEVGTSDELVLAMDGVSDYVIVYDEKDSLSRSIAGVVWEVIYRITGARLEIVNVSKSSERYQKEIVIFNARPEISVLIEGVSNDYLIASKEKTLFIWADSDEMKEYLSLYLRDGFSKYSSGKKVSIPLNMHCRYSDGSSGASYLKLIEDGKCDFVVVYDGNDTELTKRVQSFVTRFANEYGIHVVPKNLRKVTTVYAHEILFGNARDYASDLLKQMNPEDDFVIGATGGHLVCYATDDASWDYMFEYLLSDYFKTNNHSLIVDCNNPFIRSASELAQISYVEYYQSIYHTYSSRVDEFRAKKLNESDAEDCDLIDALIKRMGDGFAVYPGSSSALYKGYIIKLNKTDYSKVTKVKDGHLMIASEFAKEYFGIGIPTDADGYSDVSAYLETHNQYTLYRDTATGVWTVTTQDVSSFGSTENVCGYTNAEFLRRMKVFFENKYIPEPELNTEQSRVILVEDTEQNVEQVTDWSVAKYQSFFDPAILSVEENGKTVLYAMYVNRIWNNGRFTSPGSDLLVSQDGGVTWTLACSFPKITAAPSLVSAGGYIYAICGFASMQIGRYDPATGKSAFAEHKFALGKSGPGTLLVYGGRIYRPYGNAVVSAEVGANLLVSSSWTVSNSVSGLATESFFRSVGLNGHGWKAEDGTYVDWEEGNVVPGTDGSLYVVYRQNITNRCALIFRLSTDGKILSYTEEVNGIHLEKKSYISIPSAKSRHAIRYDADTGLYISLMNVYTGDASTSYSWADAQQRSVLGLVVSKDLVNWETVEILLVDRKMMNPVLSVFAHGFQYVDFTIADGNIYFVVRENSGEKTVDYHHEANYVTFYTIENYRSLLQSEIS